MPIGAKQSRAPQPPAEPARAVTAEPEQPKAKPKKSEIHWGQIPDPLLADWRVPSGACRTYGFIWKVHKTTGNRGCKERLADIARGTGRRDPEPISNDLAALVQFGYLVEKRPRRRGEATHYTPVAWDRLPPVPDRPELGKPEPARPHSAERDRPHAANRGRPPSTNGEDPLLLLEREDRKSHSNSARVAASSSSPPPEPSEAGKLVELYAQLRSQHDRHAYSAGPADHRHAEVIIGRYGAERATLMVRALFAPEGQGLHWVTHKRLRWLANPDNEEYAVDGARAFQRGPAVINAEWKGSGQTVGLINLGGRHGR